MVGNAFVLFCSVQALALSYQRVETKGLERRLELPPMLADSATCADVCEYERMAGECASTDEFACYGSFLSYSRRAHFSSVPWQALRQQRREEKHHASPQRRRRPRCLRRCASVARPWRQPR